MRITQHCPRCGASTTTSGTCPVCVPYASLPVGSADYVPPVAPAPVPLTEDRIREIAREEAKAVVAKTMERLIDDAEADDRARRQ